MKKKLAIVTMAYNEKYKLPRWIRHFTKQAGAEQFLYVIDHGSTDGSTTGLGAVNVHRLEREEGKAIIQTWRVQFVSQFCNDLLNEYEYVIYTDADELLIADPKRFESLLHYVSTSEVIRPTAYGLDVLHDIKNESDLDPEKPVLAQRNNLQFVAAMCKPTVIHTPSQWVQGFHYGSNPPAFGDLYLFHLRYADLNEGLDRLSLTRSLDRPDKQKIIDHQKISDDTFKSWVVSWLRFEKSTDAIDNPTGEIAKYVSEFKYEKDNQGNFRFDYSLRAPKIFSVPEHFKQLL